MRAAVVVAGVTLLALFLPTGAPLYAQVYPAPDADTLAEAITDATLDAGFDSPSITQFETATFRASVIYGTSSPDPGLPTVKVAWSNEARLTAQEDDTFNITPTSVSRQFLDGGDIQPDGGYRLTWTWDVTPLVDGEQTLIVSIIPTVVVKGEVIPQFANINDPVEFTVDIHPGQQDFDEVVAAAESMETDVPDNMIVGDEYAVSASMSLEGHADTVGADIGLAQGAGSASVTIVKEPAEAGTAAQVTSAASDDGKIVRRWTVTPNEPGQVNLVFTASVQGEAATFPLDQKVLKQGSVSATERGPSFWDVLQQPVQYLAPFVALALGLLGLWAAWKKRKAREDDSDGGGATGSSGDPASS